MRKNKLHGSLQPKTSNSTSHLNSRFFRYLKSGSLTPERAGNIPLHSHKIETLLAYLVLEVTVTVAFQISLPEIIGINSDRYPNPAITQDFKQHDKNIEIFKPYFFLRTEERLKSLFQFSLAFNRSVCSCSVIDQKFKQIKRRSFSTLSKHFNQHGCVDMGGLVNKRLAFLCG